MPNRINENIVRVLGLACEMLMLADHGEQHSKDTGCNLLYASLRDSAFKIRRLAEDERELHRLCGSWDIEEKASSENGQKYADDKTQMTHHNGDPQ